LALVTPQIEEVLDRDNNELHRILISFQTSDAEVESGKFVSNGRSRGQIRSDILNEANEAQLEFKSWLFDQNNLDTASFSNDPFQESEIPYANGTALYANSSLIDAIRKRNDVKWISKLKPVGECDYRIHNMGTVQRQKYINVPKTLEANYVWERYTGSGIVCAVIDSGVNLKHPFLKHAAVNGTLEASSKSFAYPGKYLNDSTGHGTACAGLIAGVGEDDAPIGMAPNSKIYNVKICPTDQMSILIGFQHALKCGFVDVVSCSLSWGVEEDANKGCWRNLCVNALKLGILHANSVGNEGNAACIGNGNYKIPLNVNVPGSCPPPSVRGNIEGGVSSTISVGASIFTADGRKRENASSKGPSDWFFEPFHDYPTKKLGADPLNPGCHFWSGGLIKPDLCTLGKNVLTLRHNFNGIFGKYAIFGGSSAATAIVAGALCLMAEARLKSIPIDKRDSYKPNPAEFLELLEDGCDKMIDQPTMTGKSNGFGAGTLNLKRTFEIGSSNGLWT